MAKKSKTPKEDVLLTQVCEFVWQFSNVCWNCANEKKYKEAQELGVDRLMTIMPNLCSAFLHKLSVDKESPFAIAAQIIDEGVEMANRQMEKEANAKKSRRGKAKGDVQK